MTQTTDPRDVVDLVKVALEETPAGVPRSPAEADDEMTELWLLGVITDEQWLATRPEVR